MASWTISRSNGVYFLHVRRELDPIKAFDHLPSMDEVDEAIEQYLSQTPKDSDLPRGTKVERVDFVRDGKINRLERQVQELKDQLTIAQKQLLNRDSFGRPLPPTRPLPGPRPFDQGGRMRPGLPGSRPPGAPPSRPSGMSEYYWDGGDPDDDGLAGVREPRR